jgi:2-oxoglutarate dehydrogenase complex dehydrogenase (E1) component-like enzyme
MKKLFFAALLLSSTNIAHGQIESAVEVLRADVRSQKVAILTATMELTSEEASVFWPIFREYEVALSSVWDRRLDVIKDYAANYETMTDEIARGLIERAFAVDEEQLAVEKKYFEEVAEVLPVTKAARFVQVDRQLNRMIAVQIASELPLVKAGEREEEGGCGP